MIEIFGDEYTNHNLVFCHATGRPMEGQVISRALKKLIKDNDLPDITFHSFRHASITYKLKWNGGDVKSVQGDSGHSQVKMVTDTYAHILDEDRCYNAQRFEEQFYQKGKEQSSPESLSESVDPKTAEKADDSNNLELITKLLSNPETAALLKALVKSI